MNVRWRQAMESSVFCLTMHCVVQGGDFMKVLLKTAALSASALRKGLLETFGTLEDLNFGRPAKYSLVPAISVSRERRRSRQKQRSF